MTSESPVLRRKNCQFLCNPVQGISPGDFAFYFQANFIISDLLAHEYILTTAHLAPALSRRSTKTPSMANAVPKCWCKKSFKRLRTCRRFFCGVGGWRLEGIKRPAPLDPLKKFLEFLRESRDAHQIPDAPSSPEVSTGIEMGRSGRDRLHLGGPWLFCLGFSKLILGTEFGTWL